MIDATSFRRRFGHLHFNSVSGRYVLDGWESTVETRFRSAQAANGLDGELRWEWEMCGFSLASAP